MWAFFDVSQNIEPQNLSTILWYYTHFQIHTIQLNVDGARGSLLFIEDRCVYVYIVMFSVICNTCIVLIITFIMIVPFLLVPVP